MRHLFSSVVESLNDVVRVRHVEDAPVRDRRPRLTPILQAARPDHAQLSDVLPGDLIEGTVPPAVERPAPHEPVLGGGILEHRVRNGDEVASRLGLDGRLAQDQ